MVRWMDGWASHVHNTSGTIDARVWVHAAEKTTIIECRERESNEEATKPPPPFTELLQAVAFYSPPRG